MENRVKNRMHSKAMYRMAAKLWKQDSIAIPTFCGHLASEYFKFWERSQTIFRWRYGLE